MHIASRLSVVIPWSIPLSLLVVTMACLSPDNPFDPDTPESEQAKATLHGKVVDASGIVDGAEVVLVHGDTTVEAASDDEGNFTLSAIPGVSTLVVRHPTHQDAVRDVVLLPGETRTVDVTLAALLDDANTGHIRGIARKAASLDDQVPDHSGIVVEVAEVGARTITNHLGTYDLLIAPGTYDLAFSAPAHLPTSAGGVVVAAGEDTDLETITLPVNPGSVHGTVTLEPLVPGTETHGGVAVTIGNSTVFTVDDDTYQITGLPEGPIVARYTREGWQQQEKLVIVESGLLSELDSVLLARATGSVLGSVVTGLADNSGVTITLRGASGTFSASTAQDGTFTVTNVPTGAYDVAARRDGFAPANAGSVTVLADVTTVLDDPIALVALVGDFLINGGARFTNNAVVGLSLVAPAGTTQMRISESPAFNGAVALTFDPSPDFTLQGGDGTRDVFVQFIDGSGTAGDTFSSSIILDSVAPLPVSFAINSGAAFTNEPNGIVALAIAASDAPLAPVDESSGVDQMQLSEDGVFDDEPFVPFSSSLVTQLLGAAEGAHTLAVRFSDGAGNVTDPTDALAATITLDRVNPAVTSITIRDPASSSTDFAFSPFVDVQVVGSADTVSMALSTDPLFPVESFATFQPSSSFLLSPGDGTRTVSVKLKDAAGNISTALTDSIVVDTVGPQAPAILVAGGAEVTADDTPVLLLSASGASAVRLSLSGAFAADQSDFTATFPVVTPDLGSDGIKTVFAQFRDDAGNLSDVVVDTIALDTVAPIPELDAVLVNGGLDFADSVSVNVAFHVAGATEMAVAVDDNGVTDEDFQPFSQSVTVLLPSQECTAATGLDCRVVCAVFRDAAGNTSAELCDAITLDTTVPSTPLIVEDDAVVSNALCLPQAGDLCTFTLHLVDVTQDDFFDHFEVLVDPRQPDFEPITPGALVAGQAPLAITLDEPAAGSAPSEAAQHNLIRVRAVDQAGNVSPESALSIIVDNVAPDAPDLAGLPNPLNADTVSVNFRSDNDDATFDHYLIDTTLLPAPFATTLRDGIVVTLLPDVINTVTVQAVDAAGNVSAPSSETVREDSQAPFAPSVAPFFASVRTGGIGGGVNATGIPVEIGLTAESQDLVSGVLGNVSRYQLKDGAGEGFKEVGNAPPFLAFLKPFRDNEVCVRGVDAAGNVSIEDCTVLSEDSKTQITSNADQAQSYDVVGDTLFFLRRGEVVVRDLRGQFDDVIAVASGSPQSPGGNARIRASGDAHRAFAVFESSGGNITLLQVNLAGPLTPASITTAQIPGENPYVRGPDMVYTLNQKTILHRESKLVSGFNDDVSGEVTLCQGTGPRVDSGVVIWCENRALFRHEIGRPAGGDRIDLGGALSLVEAGSLVGGGPPGGVQQPQVADGTIAWAEDSLLGEHFIRFLRLTSGPGTVAAGNVQSLDIQSADLRDLSRDLVAMVQVHDGITSDIAFTSLASPKELNITDDVNPQSEPQIDGSRIYYSDTSVGDVIQRVDLSTTRWLRASSELTFEGVTSRDASAWIESDGGQLHVAARVLPLEGRARQIIDAGLAITFSGPSKADPPYGVGGRRIVFSTGNSVPFSLFLRELDASSGVALGAQPTLVVNDAAGPFAVDPDGDKLAYVDQGGTVQLVNLTTLAKTAVAMAGTGTIIMIDLDDDVIVAQRGGDPQREDGLSGSGQAVCAVAGGATGIIPIAPFTAVRGPKVAHTRNGNFQLAAVGNNGGALQDDAFTCTLTCGAAPTCAVENASSGLLSNIHVRIGRDARVSFLSNETGLNQVVVFDSFAHQWTFVTGGDFDRGGLDAAEGRLVWDDPTLGGFAVFELNLQ